MKAAIARHIENFAPNHQEHPPAKPHLHSPSERASRSPRCTSGKAWSPDHWRSHLSHLM
ncbi:hypothetical protein [Calothrix sp. NIES-2100]|uniref:hypothetical protein n=1 Tax=Calothrix sp. NIES-2100 TaxID=1954172 RepID=UPI0030DA8007